MGITSSGIPGLQLSCNSAGNGDDDANVWGSESSACMVYKQYHAST